MKEFKTLYESWQYCQYLTTLSLDELEKISGDEYASLYIQAEKHLIKEVLLMSYELGFKPYDAWFVNKESLGDYIGVLYGNISIGFDSLFYSKDYNYFLCVIIHMFCRTRYAYRNKAFWELFDSCIKKIGLIGSEYNGWAVNQNKGAKYNIPFKKTRLFKGYDIICQKLFENLFDDFYILKPEYLQMNSYRHEHFYKEKLPLILHGESILRPVSQMIRQILDHKAFILNISEAKKMRHVVLQDLAYLKDEREVLCLYYDSRVKKGKDEERMSYCVAQMKADKRFDFSDYTSCIIDLTVDPKHKLNLKTDLDRLNELPIPPNMNLTVTYSCIDRGKNVNKCEMMVVFSKK